MARRERRFTSFAAALCLLLLLPGTTATGGDDPFGSREIVFGYSSHLLSQVSRSDAQAALALWTKEILRLAEYPAAAKTIIYENMPALINAVRQGKVDLIAISPLDYLRIRSMALMEPALVGIRGGKVGDEQVLIVRREDGIRSVHQLRGRLLTLLTAYEGEIASLWLDTTLAKQGLPNTPRFFGSLKAVPQASQAILSVFFKQADACLVNRNAFSTAVELNPQIGRDLVVLESSQVIPLGISCLSSSLTKAQKEEIITLSIKMTTTPTGRQVLTLFKVESVEKAPKNILDYLETLLKEHESYQTLAKGNR